MSFWSNFGRKKHLVHKANYACIYAGSSFLSIPAGNNNGNIHHKGNDRKTNTKKDQHFGKDPKAWQKLRLNSNDSQISS